MFSFKLSVWLIAFYIGLASLIRNAFAKIQHKSLKALHHEAFFLKITRQDLQLKHHATLKGNFPNSSCLKAHRWQDHNCKSAMRQSVAVATFYCGGRLILLWRSVHSIVAVATACNNDDLLVVYVSVDVTVQGILQIMPTLESGKKRQTVFGCKRQLALTGGQLP